MRNKAERGSGGEGLKFLGVKDLGVLKGVETLLLFSAKIEMHN